MKKTHCLSIILTAMLFIASSPVCMASVVGTVSFYIDGTPNVIPLGYDTGIAGFKFFFTDVTPISWANGNALPQFYTSYNSNSVQGHDQSPGLDKPMVDGLIGQLTYSSATGAIAWDHWAFNDYTTTPRTISEVTVTGNLANGGAVTFHINVVPVPGALWLLGSDWSLSENE